MHKKFILIIRKEADHFENEWIIFTVFTVLYDLNAHNLLHIIVNHVAPTSFGTSLSSTGNKICHV